MPVNQPDLNRYPSALALKLTTRYGAASVALGLCPSYNMQYGCLCVREYGHTGSHESAEPGRPGRRTWRQILRHKSMRLFALGNQEEGILVELPAKASVDLANDFDTLIDVTGDIEYETAYQEIYHD